jgi:hypothetical protein
MKNTEVYRKQNTPHPKHNIAQTQRVIYLSNRDQLVFVAVVPYAHAPRNEPGSLQDAGVDGGHIPPKAPTWD